MPMASITAGTKRRMRVGVREPAAVAAVQVDRREHAPGVEVRASRGGPALRAGRHERSSQPAVSDRLHGPAGISSGRGAQPVPDPRADPGRRREGRSGRCRVDARSRCSPCCWCTAARSCRVDRAVDELWEGAGPQHASKAVHVWRRGCAARWAPASCSRRAADTRCAWRAGGLDADRFEELSARGRAELAARRTAGGRGDAAPGARAVARPGARGRQPTSASRSRRSRGSRTCGSPAWATASTPTWPAAGTRRSSASSRRSCGSIRCASGSAASRCSPSIAPGARPRPSRRTAGLSRARRRPRHRAVAGAAGAGGRRSCATTCRPRRRRRGRPVAVDARRLVTCVFAQLTHAGERASLDAESLRDGARSATTTRARAICARHGGVVAELRSDAVLAVFGAPIAHEDDPQRALRAAAELVAEPSAAAVRRARALRRLHRRGRRARAWRRRGAVIGEAVARRSGSRAPPRPARSGWTPRPGGWCATARTHPSSPTAGSGYTARRRRAGDPATARPPRSSGASTSWHVCATAFARVARRAHARVLAIIGEPGIGKSHLAAELAAIAGDARPVLTGRCPAHGEGIDVLAAARDRRAGDGRPLDRRARRLAGGRAVGGAPGGRRGRARGRPRRRGHRLGLPAADRRRSRACSR